MPATEGRNDGFEDDEPRDERRSTPRNAESEGDGYDETNGERGQEPGQTRRAEEASRKDGRHDADDGGTKDDAPPDGDDPGHAQDDETIDCANHAGARPQSRRHDAQTSREAGEGERRAWCPVDEPGSSAGSSKAPRGMNT